MKLRIGPMLGFKWFTTAAIVAIAGIELLRRIHKGQLTNLWPVTPSRDKSTSAVWNASIGSVIKIGTFETRAALQFKLHQNRFHLGGRSYSDQLVIDSASFVN